MAAVEQAFNFVGGLIEGAVSTVIGAPPPAPSALREYVPPTSYRPTLASSGDAGGPMPRYMMTPFNGSGPRLPDVTGAGLDAPSRMEWVPITPSPRSRGEVIAAIQDEFDGRLADETAFMEPEEAQDHVRGALLSSPSIGQDTAWRSDMSPSDHRMWRMLPRHWSQSEREQAIRTIEGVEDKQADEATTFGTYDRARSMYHLR